jgi:hypothetical protein
MRRKPVIHVIPIFPAQEPTFGECPRLVFERIVFKRRLPYRSRSFKSRMGGSDVGTVGIGCALRFNSERSDCRPSGGTVAIPAGAVVRSDRPNRPEMSPRGRRGPQSGSGLAAPRRPRGSSRRQEVRRRGAHPPPRWAMRAHRACTSAVMAPTRASWAAQNSRLRSAGVRARRTFARLCDPAATIASTGIRT